MSVTAVFTLGLLITAGIALLVVIYLKRPLQKVLIDLCGNVERAAFWTAFSMVALTLSPLILAMTYTPEVRAGSPLVLELAAQLKWGLVGLLVAVVILGWVLSRFIPRSQAAHSPQR
ncbi:MAG TPA: hypothetical protein VE994_00165 [Terriglobales bacterium]|nr:hypothetical protein [Terriglobales bacterium]